MISLVTAKVMRSDEARNSNVAKSERYLVEHTPEESAGVVVADWLGCSNAMVEIESVVRQKNTTLRYQNPEPTAIYKVTLHEYQLTEKGKVKKVPRRVYVEGEDLECGLNTTIKEEGLHESQDPSTEVVSICKTNIVEFITSPQWNK